MRKWIIGAVVLVILMVGAYAALKPDRGGTAAARQQAKEAEVLPPVKADPKIMADGKVVPVRSAAVSFTTSGVVAKVLVKEGEWVEAGQVLARLESTRQTVMVAQAEAQLERATARLQELQAGARAEELAAAQAALDRAKAHLSRVKVAGPPVDIAIAEADVKSAQAQYDLLKAGARPETIAAAKAELAAAKAALEQARLELAETELTAPFAGEVAALRLNPGEYVSAGSPVLRIVDTSAWQIQTDDLNELNVVRISVGDAAIVTFDALPGLEIDRKSVV